MEGLRPGGTDAACGCEEASASENRIQINRAEGLFSLTKRRGVWMANKLECEFMDSVVLEAREAFCVREQSFHVLAGYALPSLRPEYGGRSFDFGLTIET